MSDYNSDDFIGMPEKANNTSGNLQHIDTQLGNPLGDQVDNSAGENNVKGTLNGKPVRNVRGGSGSIRGISSKPSWLY